MKKPARRRPPVSAPGGPVALEKLRMRAEVALEARPPAHRRRAAPREVEHELQVHEVELQMQNDELTRLNTDLESAHDWYRELYDSAPVGYVTTSRTGSIIAANRLSGKILGVEPHALVTQRLDAFVEPGSKAVFLEHRRQVLDGRDGHDCEVRLERADGQLIDVHLESAKQTRTVASKDWQIKTVLIDVTSARRLERMILEGQRELAHVLRVQTLGELAPALAHELSQPLQAIQVYATAAQNELARRKGKPDPLMEIVRAIATQSDRAEELLARAREFVRKAPLALVSTDLNALIRKVASFVAPLAKERRIRIVLRLSAGIPALPLDVVGIQQILFNLILNSFEAMAEMPPGRRVLRIESALSGVTAQITVTDRGEGLGGQGAAHVERIFSSFYSTKPAGLGLGLAISRRIAELQGGTLRAGAVRRRGAAFTITLPLKKI